MDLRAVMNKGFKDFFNAIDADVFCAAGNKTARRANRVCIQKATTRIGTAP